MSDKVSQKGIINIGLSDHQLIYCTRKILRAKLNRHNQIQVRSLKKYSAEAFRIALEKINFPNYDIFSNVNTAYKDLLRKVTNTLDNIAPIKELRVKNNTQDWFDNEVNEAIKIRDKMFKKFKKSNLHIDYDIYLEAKHNVKNLVKQKKASFIKRN